MNSNLWHSTELIYTEQGYWMYVLKNGVNKITCKSRKNKVLVKEDIEVALARLNRVSIKLKNPN